MNSLIDSLSTFPEAKTLIKVSEDYKSPDQLEEIKRADTLCTMIKSAIIIEANEGRRIYHIDNPVLRDYNDGYAFKWTLDKLRYDMYLVRTYLYEDLNSLGYIVEFGAEHEFYALTIKW